MAYLTLGNLEWMGGRCDEFLFVERQAHRETALMMLLDAFPPDFALLDAYEQAADGLIGIMGCPHPKSPKRLYASEDALALDLVAARHMGVSDPHRANILRAACHWFGDPSERTEVVGTDEPLSEWRGPYDTEFSTLLSAVAYPPTAAMKAAARPALSNRPILRTRGTSPSAAAMAAEISLDASGE